MKRWTKEKSVILRKKNSTWLLAAAPIERFLGPKEMQALEEKTFKHQTLLQHYIQVGFYHQSRQVF